MYAINPADGSVVWQKILKGTVIAPVTLANGIVYAASTTGLEAFDSKTGESVWTDPAQAMMYSQPILVDGVLYTTYLNGRVTAWMAPSGSPEVQSAVANNLMPFAEVPYNRYWNDNLAKNQLNSFFSSKPSACVNGCDTCSTQCNVAEGSCMARAWTS